MVCPFWFKRRCSRSRPRDFCLSLSTKRAIGSRSFSGMVLAWCSTPTDLTHTARFRGSAKLLYPYHPLFDASGASLEITGVRSDMLVARLPDNSRRGIPAWMFDAEVCATIRELPHPVIHSASLLEIVDILEHNGLGARNTGDEFKTQSKECCESSSTANSGKPSFSKARSRQPDPRGKKIRVRRADSPTDRGRRPSTSNSRRRVQ